jgi:hypothetical protein
MTIGLKHFARVPPFFRPRHLGGAAVVKRKGDGEQLEEAQRKAHATCEETRVPNLRLEVPVAPARDEARRDVLDHVRGATRRGEMRLTVCGEAMCDGRGEACYTVCEVRRGETRRARPCAATRSYMCPRVSSKCHCSAVHVEHVTCAEACRASGNVCMSTPIRFGKNVRELRGPFCYALLYARMGDDWHRQRDGQLDGAYGCALLTPGTRWVPCTRLGQDSRWSPCCRKNQQ